MLQSGVTEEQRSSLSLEENREGRCVVGLVMAVPAFLLFWSFRAVELTGGDSDQWIREMEAGVWWRKRQMLSFATMQLTYTLTNRSLGWDGRWAINASSCLAGACFVYLVWRLLGGRPSPRPALGLIFSAGFMQLFFGHLETYALPMTCLVFLFLMIRRYLAGHLRAIHVAAVFSLGVCFHLVFWFLLPVFGTLLRHSRRRRRDLFEITMGLSPAILLTVLMWFSSRLGIGEMLGDRFMPLFEVEPGVSRHYALFSRVHVHEWLWFAWNSSHLALPIVALGLICRRFRRVPWAEVLLTSIVSFLVFTFFWHPDARRLDWDLFSFTALPVVLLAIEMIREWRYRWVLVLVWVAVGISAALLAVKVVDAARLGARGEGTVLIRFDPNNRATTVAIVLDGHAKKAEIRHVLEGHHTVMVYQSLDGKILKHTESFDMQPGETYEIVIPATPQVQGDLRMPDQ